MTEAFKNRVLIAFALLCLLGGSVYAGPILFSVLIAVMLLIAGFEWGRLARLSKMASGIYAGIVIIMCLTGFGQFMFMELAVAVSIGLMLWKPKWTALAGILVLPYIFSVIISFLIPVSEHSFSYWWFAVMYIWTTVIVMDTGAYVVGKAFGKTPLWLSVSPGKTWEGFLGGLSIVAVCISIFYILMADSLGLQSMHLWISGTIILAIFAQLGDLCESQMKRIARVKNSGTLLQSHGGVLDRVDGLLGAIFVVGVLSQIILFLGM